MSDRISEREWFQRHVWLVEEMCFERHACGSYHLFGQRRIIAVDPQLLHAPVSFATFQRGVWNLVNKTFGRRRSIVS